PVVRRVWRVMQKAVLGAIGGISVSLPFPAADAGDFATFARRVGLKGASVTIPFKVPLLDYVTDVEPAARTIGALNTLRMDTNGWHARNTDADGFLRPLDERRASLAGCPASILGSGGSARAAAVALASRKA